MANKPKKRCFVACPIGDPRSDIRRRTDGIIDQLIRPVAEPKGYEVLGAHKDFRSGPVTYQIVEHLRSDELVIADLTGINANVVYEIAIRHAAQKPIILVIQTGEEGDIPFDLNHQRVLPIDYGHWDTISSTREDLGSFIDDAQSNPGAASQSPVANALLVSSPKETTDEDVNLAVLGKVLSLASDLSSLRQEVRLVARAVGPPALPPNGIGRPKGSLAEAYKESAKIQQSLSPGLMEVLGLVRSAKAKKGQADGT